MSNIDTINVGGLDYDIEDATAREQATSAISVSAYVENGNTASRAYPTVGTPINWKGSLYYTTATIAQGATLASGTNLAAAANLGQYLMTNVNNVQTSANRIRTYVGSDSKLHFTDATGADTALNFSTTKSVPVSVSVSGSSPISSHQATNPYCTVYVSINGVAYSFTGSLTYVYTADDYIQVSASDSRTITV